MSVPVDWVGDKPADVAEWERIIGGLEAGGSVRMRQVASGWLVEAARKAASPPKPPVDFRWHLTEELKKAGKPVIGVDTLQGGFPLSPEREAAIRHSLDEARRTPPDPAVGANKYDVEIVADLVGEIDRLRSKLRQAALARDLTSRAATSLTDACDDISPRPARFRKTSKDANE